MAAVTGFLALLSALGAVFMLPPELLGLVGLWTLGVGVIVGMPSGIAWHAALFGSAVSIWAQFM